MTSTTQAYQASLTKFIQAHMVMIGPSVVLSLVRKIHGITVSNTGVVQHIDFDPLEVVKQISGAFAPFGGVLTLRIQTRLLQETTPSGNATAIMGQP